MPLPHRSSLPTSLYGADPRSIVKKTPQQVAAEASVRREKEARRRKKEGKILNTFNKWQVDLGKMVMEVDSEVDHDFRGYSQVRTQTSSILLAVTGPPLEGTLEEGSFVTQYREPNDDKPHDKSSPTTHSPPSEVAPPSPSDYQMWAEEAKQCHTYATTFLSPVKKFRDEPPPREPWKETTIAGERNDLATIPATDPETTQYVRSMTETGLNTDHSVMTHMSHDQLANHKLFLAKRESARRLMTPKTISSTTDSLLKREITRDGNDPSEKSNTTGHAATAATRRPSKKVQKLYEMEMPVLPRGYEMEEFQAKNEELKARILVKSGKLPAHVLDKYEPGQQDSPPPYPLGENPLAPRTGGRVEPSFYNIKRNVSPERVPNSHLSLWQHHADEAPRSVEMGLGVMSFVLPEQEGVDQQRPLESTQTLGASFETTLGKGLYHDKTASVIAAPMDAAGLVPQSQPYGFDVDKPKMRVSGMADALQFLGDLSPRTKLHHFQMFPYSTDAHEAAFILQQFWQRHLRRRWKAATLCQAHFRRLRTHRAFAIYLAAVRRAKKEIGDGVRRWIHKTRARTGAGVAYHEIMKELATEYTELWHIEHERDEKVRYAFTTLLWRYRWLRRVKKRRRRRKELEEVCCVRMQRGVRYFLVQRMMKRWLHGHKVLKRSFRLYFFRKYKKQVRRIMGKWRNYFFCKHIKMIQRLYRGMRGRRRVKRVRQELIGKEGVRGARELEVLNSMLLDVEEVMAKHVLSKAGKAEIKSRVKEVKSLFKTKKKEGVTKEMGAVENMGKEIGAWLAMFEVPEDENAMNTDGFVDVKSLEFALKALVGGDNEELLGEEEREEMVKELDVYGNGLIASELVVGWLVKKMETAREEAGGEEEGGFVGKVRGRVCGGKKCKIVGGNEYYLEAARRSLKEKERKRYMIKALSAVREGGGSGGQVARVVCESCSRPFSHLSVAAQGHILAGGCVMRPSVFLPMNKSDFN